MTGACACELDGDCVAAGITGPGYPGAGSTIGVAMTFGYIAGRHVAGA